MRKSRNKYLILILFFVFLVSGSLQAQQNYLNNERKKNENQNAASFVFREIEHGMADGNVSDISRFLDSQTFISLSNGTSGYYSSNQAFYVLKDFFSVYKITSFRFQNIQINGDTPYATGVYKYRSKGEKGFANVYISLKKTGHDWKITQLTIN